MYCRTKDPFGLNVRVPCGYKNKATGGGSVSVSKDGIKVSAPDVNEIIEEVTGGKRTAADEPEPDAPPVETTVGGATNLMKGLLAASGAALVLGLYLTVRK